MRHYEVEKTDVLIIGSGCAGMIAALNCARSGIKTTLVSKGPIGRSGITVAGFNGFGGNFDQPGDSPENHLKDIVLSGKYLCDQDVAEQLAVEAKFVFAFCESIGIRFHKDDSNAYHISPAAGCELPRLVAFSGGGFQLLKNLKDQLSPYAESRISVHEDLLITKLLVNDCSVTGAVGIDLKSGSLKAFHCKSLILAGGGAGYLWPHSDCPPESVGDIFSLAYRAGIKIVNMEQQLHYPTVGLYPEYIKGLCASYEWIFDAENPEQGGLLYNNNNQVFYPVDKVGTRDEICYVIAKEIIEGKGTPEGGVYLDARNCSRARKEIIKKTLLSYNRFLHFGIDVLNERIQVAPAAHTTLGGIKISKDAETSVKGVFACGECTGNVHGANRLAGHAFLDAFIFGKKAAHAAWQHVQEIEEINPLDFYEIEEECKNLLSYLIQGYGDKQLPSELKNKISRLVGEYLGPIRNREGLERAINNLELLRKKELPAVGAPDIRIYNLDWINCLEAKHMMDCAEMIARCALAREESRGTHFRDDFPLMNNEHPVEHTVVVIQNETMVVKREKVKMSSHAPEKVKAPIF